MKENKLKETIGNFISRTGQFFKTDRGKKIKRGILWGFLILITVFSVVSCGTATRRGHEAGEAQGKLVGNALGTWEGITHGIQDGTEAGREAGLHAYDFETEVNTVLNKAGNLEILSAEVRIGDTFKIEDSYKLFFSLQGKAVFTVDLANAELRSTEDCITVVLDQPSVTFIKDMDKTYKIAEKVNSHWWQSQKNAKDAIDGYVETLKNIDKELTRMADYDLLMDEARQSAITQVTNLVNSVQISDIPFEIVFR